MDQNAPETDSNVINKETIETLNRFGSKRQALKEVLTKVGAL